MLLIQDPTNPQSPFLLESLVDAFQSAEKIAGAFAFASAAGVKLFTESPAFQKIARRFPIDLVVGVDAVTNERALDSLLAASVQNPNMKVRAFLNPRRGAMFHPKFCWTKSATGGNLITGSGNLTQGGLLRNWEAYTVEKLGKPGIQSVESAWDMWTARHNGSLLPLDDVAVRGRAAANNVFAPEGDLPTLVAPPAPQKLGVQPPGLQFSGVAAVLIKEIPRASNRWNQVNFHHEEFIDFFGAQEGIKRVMVFSHVNEAGTIAEYEPSRPPVTVESRNFRFELAAAAGKAYPDSGRPIGVFIRMASQEFFYRLLLPGDPEYTNVQDILQNRAGPPMKKMRSERMTVDELRLEWPTAPFWNLPIVA